MESSGETRGAQIDGVYRVPAAARRTARTDPDRSGSGMANARTRPTLAEEVALDFAPSPIQLWRGPEPLDADHGVRAIDDQLVPVPSVIRPDLASNAGGAAAKEVEHL